MVSAMFETAGHLELTLWRILHLLRGRSKSPFNLLQLRNYEMAETQGMPARLTSMVSLYDCRRLRIWSVIRVKNL